MARPTPESKVKKKLIACLKSLGDDCFYYMPVQNGMGQSGIPDVMAIIHRIPFAFECKATSKQDPTTLQAMALERIHKAGGFAWVVDNESVDLVIHLITRGFIPTEDFERDDAKKFAESKTAQPLYRWKKKLEVMEI